VTLYPLTTPLVEVLSIDKALLDVRGMERIAGTPVEIAVRLCRAARERIGLPLTHASMKIKSSAVPAPGRRAPACNSASEQTIRL
jgi:DNA polymerase IV